MIIVLFPSRIIWKTEAINLDSYETRIILLNQPGLLFRVDFLPTLIHAILEINVFSLVDFRPVYSRNRILSLND